VASSLCSHEVQALPVDITLWIVSYDGPAPFSHYGTTCWIDIKSHFPRRKVVSALPMGLMPARGCIKHPGHIDKGPRVFHVILARTKIPQDWKVPEIPSIQNLGITKEIRRSPVPHFLPFFFPFSTPTSSFSLVNPPLTKASRPTSLMSRNRAGPS
jgi:hypothetical protein